MTTPAKARAAVKKEATPDELPEKVTITYDGEDYEIEVAAFDDIEVMEAVEENKFVGAVKALLGPAQWLRFKSKKRSYSVDVVEILNLISKEIAGVTVGESKG